MTTNPLHTLLHLTLTVLKCIYCLKHVNTTLLPQKYDMVKEIIYWSFWIYWEIWENSWWKLNVACLRLAMSPAILYLVTTKSSAIVFSCWSSLSAMMIFYGLQWKLTFLNGLEVFNRKCEQSLLTCVTVSTFPACCKKNLKIERAGRKPLLQNTDALS